MVEALIVFMCKEPEEYESVKPGELWAFSMLFHVTKLINCSGDVPNLRVHIMVGLSLYGGRNSVECYRYVLCADVFNDVSWTEQLAHWCVRTKYRASLSSLESPPYLQGCFISMQMPRRKCGKDLNFEQRDDLFLEITFRIGGVW